MSAFVTAIICALVAAYRDAVSAGVAGLILSYALLFCDSINWMIIVSTDVEKAVVAAERIEEYAHVKNEAPWKVDGGPDLGKKWPSEGRIVFTDYSTRYRFDDAAFDSFVT